MRNMDDVTGDVVTTYESIQEMFQHWHKGRHTEFMAAMWQIHDLREEVALLTGNREQAHVIVSGIYRSVFSPVLLLQE